MDMDIYRFMSYGVYVVSSVKEKKLVGCIANSVMQVTATPESIAVSISHDNYTHHAIKESGKFSISILAETTTPYLIGTFGFSTSKDTDKFEGIEYEIQEDIPVLKDSCGYLVCKVISQLETDTHTIFVGEVIKTEVYDSEKSPMTYDYYHKELKGKSPKNAPTYRAESGEQVTKFVCKVCGYEYIGDQIPEDYKCPICKQGIDKFEKVVG